MALVGEPFLTATVQVPCEKIASQDFQQFLKQHKLNVQLLQKMRMTLLTLQAVLNDAEEKQVTNPAVEEWLTEPQVAVFDAEDLLDEINYRDLKKTTKRQFETSAFSNDQWKLSITNLENIVADKDAYEVKLNDKEDIEELVLEWTNDKGKNSQHENKPRRVLRTQKDDEPADI